MRRFTTILALVAILVGLFPTAPIAPLQPRKAMAATPAATTSKSTAAVPRATTDPNEPEPLIAEQIDCTTSPFGRSLLIGSESEVLVGYRGGTSTPTYGWLYHTQFDQNTSGDLQAQRTLNAGNLDPRFKAVNPLHATTADLNGDGKTEYVQVGRDSGGGYSLIATRNTGTGAAYDLWRHTGSDFTNHTMMTATSGNYLRLGNGSQQVAAVSQSASGAVHVNIWSGAADGSIAQADGSTRGFWRSNATNRPISESIAIASGDLNTDGQDEIIVALEDASTVQIIVLGYQAAYRSGSGDNWAYDWKEIASTTVNTNADLRELNLAAGDIDGDLKDEVVLAWGHQHIDGGEKNEKIGIRTLDFNNGAFATRASWFENGDSRYLSLAVAETNLTAGEEIALAYKEWVNGQGRLTVRTLNATQNPLFNHNTWTSSADGRDNVDNVSLSGGDLDTDGLGDLVVAFQETSNLMQVVHLEDNKLAGTEMLLTNYWHSDTDGKLNSIGISVHMGDWDNNSIRAKYSPATGSSLKCKQVIEPQITAAVYLPPFWQNIQSGLYMYGTLGQSESTEHTSQTAFTTTHSHSVTGYLGAAYGIEDLFEASLKATGGYEWASSSTRSNSYTQGTTNSEGFIGTYSNYVVVDNTAYNCYSYQLQQGEQNLDGNAHYCAMQSNVQQGTALDAWDKQYGPVNNPNTLQWAPITRDWSSLTLFKGASTAQSSTAWNGPSNLAVDSNTDGAYFNGSVTHTAEQAAPNTAWWQVDLGSAQDISKISVWNRTGKECGGPCGKRLQDFHVFVSNTDMRNISNDPAVLKNDSRVSNYFTAGIASNVTNISTINDDLQPLTGRYVRVQLANTGTLSLAEVQVLGSNHVEPSRYPVRVRDSDSKFENGKTVPGKDGYFEVEMYNPQNGTYQWVRQRGNMLWNGANYSVLSTKAVGAGEVTTEWSLAQSELKDSTTATSEGRTWSVGAEFDVSAGAGVKVVAGGGYQYSDGVVTEHSSTMGWGTGLMIAGGTTGFPKTIDSQNVIWPNQCQYKFQPYYYEMTQKTSLGYEHRFMVVDYIVPTYLNRGTDLDPCLNGTNWTSIGFKQSATGLAFAQQRVGTTSAAKSVTFSNHTSSKVTIGSISLAGTNPGDYTQSSDCPVAPANLASGATCTVNVRFKPTATGTRSAELRILTDYRSTPYTVSLSGTGVEPVASLNVTSLAFGNQQLNTTSTARSVTLTNTGSMPLTITSATVGGTHYTNFTRSTNCPIAPYTLAAGSRCMVYARFKPSAAGLRSAYLELRTNAKGSPHRVSLGGTGINMALSATSLSFGSQVINTSSIARTVTVRNAGTTTLPITGITITGTGATSYSQTHTCPLSLAPGATCAVKVVFKPTVAGSRAATLNIRYSATATPRTVSLSGIGTTLSVTPASIGFGNQSVNTTSAARSVTLKNVGSTALTLSSISLKGTSAGSFVRTTTCGGTLAAGASCTVSVKFRPTVTGPRTAVLEILSNAAGSPHRVALTGTGV